VYITGITAWNEHIESNHNEVSRYFTTSGLGVTWSSFTASGSLHSTQANIVEKKRRLKETIVVTLRGRLASPISLISRD